MNRRERRGAVARGEAAAGLVAGDIAALLAEADQAARAGHFAPAEAICKRVLSRAPAHKATLNLLGLIHQATGHHRLAVKAFGKAIAADQFDAACHYNVASSYQLLGEAAAAAAHFSEALALGLSDKDVGDVLMQNPAIAEYVRRSTARRRSPELGQAAFGAAEIAAIAPDVFFRCALRSTPICGVAMEGFLTDLRRALLDLTDASASEAAKAADDLAEIFCALAQQCFINEYAFAQTDEEARRATELRDVIQQKIQARHEVRPFLLAALAAYCPLYSLTGIDSLLAAAWPGYARDLLAQQVDEPLAEARHRSAIPALTAIEDHTSLEVMRQYEESPYPRWTVNPRLPVSGGDAKPAAGEDILIAACGTGHHAFQVAQQSPQARILAIDLSRASLGYARRKTLAAGLNNIEYAQADILKLGSLDRSFDRIEAVGVLHHLADPIAGWRVLLSLLKARGVMRVGLYSETARRLVLEARTLIAERSYAATTAGIRAFRQDILSRASEKRWTELLATSTDFYSISGCRDLFFNVMEHRFTIPQLAALFQDLGLSFLGFELDAATLEAFRRRHPGAASLVNLDHWHDFEAANPDTFRRMYVFSVCRLQSSATKGALFAEQNAGRSADDTRSK